MSERNGLTPYQVAQLQAALDQAGSPAGGRLQAGLEVGSVGPGPGAGDLELSSSIRESTARGALARASANQLIAPWAWTAVTCGAAAWDSDAMWTAAAPTRLTVRTGGVYVVSAFVVWEAYASGQVMLAVRKNGIEQARVNGTAQTCQAVTAIVAAQEADYFDAGALNGTPASLNLVYYPNLCIYLGAVRMA